MKKYIAVVALIVLISGCTIPGTNIELPFLGASVKEYSDDVVVIDMIRVTPSSEIRSGESATLRVYIKNVMESSEREPQNVKVSLYNDCNLFDINLISCSGDKGGKKEGERTCNIGTLGPQSTGIIEWKLKAKRVSVENTCDIGIMVKYEYITHSTSSVTFVNKKEYERLLMEGKKISSTARISVGEGPIKPYVEVRGQPIIVEDNEGSGLMRFWIENKGKGELYGDKIKLRELKGEGITGVEDCKKKAKEIRIIGRKSPFYVCEIKLGGGERVELEKTYWINAKIEYTYSFRKTIRVDVKPPLSV
ncbi:MAG TPA: hypothetical protein ENG42_01680 [Candidatus Aenigmarchaeota archaeon]|nr:MAG: hypothetical protein DRP03_00900 [Candidatus Aenigmarchaeota archaeon]HDD46160.1 hypothetical protein [Candidatus Aenigmarchaeota archaeon]